MRDEVLKMNGLTINIQQCKIKNEVQLKPALRLYSPLGTSGAAEDN